MIFLLAELAKCKRGATIVEPGYESRCQKFHARSRDSIFLAGRCNSFVRFRVEYSALLRFYRVYIQPKSRAMHRPSFGP